MGLLGVLMLPVTGPVWGFRMIAEKLCAEAEAVAHDEGRGFAELLDLSMRRNAGRISDAEYAEQEAALLERLSAIRQGEVEGEEELEGEAECEGVFENEFGGGGEDEGELEVAEC